MPLTVADVMTRDVFAVAPDTSLLTAARLLASRHISGAPVIDDAGRPVGVLTQTDLVDPERDRTSRLGRSVYYRVNHGEALASGDDALARDGVVADVMSPFVLTVDPGTTLLDAVKLMVTDDVHRLLVTENGRLSGIVSSMDVLRAVAQTGACP